MTKKGVLMKGKVVCAMKHIQRCSGGSAAQQSESTCEKENSSGDWGG
jgi:hypothetical protein